MSGSSNSTSETDSNSTCWLSSDDDEDCSGGGQGGSNGAGGHDRAAGNGNNHNRADDSGYVSPPSSVSSSSSVAKAGGKAGEADESSTLEEDTANSDDDNICTGDDEKSLFLLRVEWQPKDLEAGGKELADRVASLEEKQQQQQQQQAPDPDQQLVVAELTERVEALEDKVDKLETKLDAERQNRVEIDAISVTWVIPDVIQKLKLISNPDKKGTITKSKSFKTGFGKMSMSLEAHRTPGYVTFFLNPDVSFNFPVPVGGSRFTLLASPKSSAKDLTSTFSKDNCLTIGLGWNKLCTIETMRKKYVHEDGSARIEAVVRIPRIPHREV